jgi:hypothetical protein
MESTRTSSEDIAPEGMIGLMKYNHKKNLWTDRQRKMGAGPAHAVPYFSYPD